MDATTLILLLDSTLRLATPLLLACLAGLFPNGRASSTSGSKARCWPPPSFPPPRPH